MWIEISLRNINFKKLLGFLDIHTRDLNAYGRKDPKDTYIFNYDEKVAKPRSDVASPSTQQCVNLNVTLEQENDMLMLCCMISLKNIINPNDSTYQKVIDLFENNGNEKEFLDNSGES